MQRAGPDVGDGQGPLGPAAGSNAAEAQRAGDRDPAGGALPRSVTLCGLSGSLLATVMTEVAAPMAPGTNRIGTSKAVPGAATSGNVSTSGSR